jgi:hypothetical protein
MPTKSKSPTGRPILPKGGGKPLPKSAAPTRPGASPIKSGGGETSNKHVRTPVATGPAHTVNVNVEAVAQQGASQGDHTTNKGSTGWKPPTLHRGTIPQVPSGNAVAGNVGRGGPGVGRTIFRSGSQGRH